jgi:hypothetical protein
MLNQSKQSNIYSLKHLEYQPLCNKSWPHDYQNEDELIAVLANAYLFHLYEHDFLFTQNKFDETGVHRRALVFIKIELFNIEVIDMISSSLTHLVPMELSVILYKKNLNIVNPFTA